MLDEKLEYLESDQKEIIVDEAALRADKKLVLEYQKLRERLEGLDDSDVLVDCYRAVFIAVMRGMFQFMLDMGFISFRDYVKQMDEVVDLSNKAYKEVVNHVS